MMEGSIILLVLIALWTWGAYALGKRAGRRKVMREMQDLPATDKQRAYSMRLADEHGRDVPDVDGMTRAQASMAIDELKAG